MIYKITYTCGSKTSAVELRIFEPDWSDESQMNFVNTCIEHYKQEDGLGGIPHEIVKVECSLDGEDWYLVESNLSK